MPTLIRECPFRVVTMHLGHRVKGYEAMPRKQAEAFVRTSKATCFALPVTTSPETALNILKLSVIQNFYNIYGRLKPKDDILEFGRILSRKFAQAGVERVEKLTPEATAIALPVDTPKQIVFQVLDDIFKGRQGDEISAPLFRWEFSRLV